MTWTSDEKLMSPPVATQSVGQKEAAQTVRRTENGGCLWNDNSFPSAYYVLDFFLLPFYVSDRDGIKSAECDRPSAGELNPVVRPLIRIRIDRLAAHKNCARVRYSFCSLDPRLIMDFDGKDQSSFLRQ